MDIDTDTEGSEADMTESTPPTAQLIEVRRLMEEHAAEPDADGIDITVEDAQGVEVWRFTPRNPSADVTLLHFHGGGYRLGSPRGFGRYFARIAAALGATVLAPKYRLSPDAAFPSALNDAVTAYQWLLARGVAAETVIVGGDSAGGGLAAALLLRIAELGLDQPRGGALFSPWLDLRVEARSYSDNAESDKLFSRTQATEAASQYLQGHDAADPLASPLLGDWGGQPPLLIHASDAEVLRDDAQLLAARAAATGVEVRFELFDGAPHVWHNAFPDTPESITAIDNWRDWIAHVREPAHRDPATPA